MEISQENVVWWINISSVFLYILADVVVVIVVGWKSYTTKCVPSKFFQKKLFTLFPICILYFPCAPFIRAFPLHTWTEQNRHINCMKRQLESFIVVGTIRSKKQAYRFTASDKHCTQMHISDTSKMYFWFREWENGISAKDQITSS